MLTVLIAFGIFATVVLLLEGVYYAYQVLSRRGKETERIKERIQEWTAKPELQQLGIVRNQSLSDIPWLHDFLVPIRKLDGLRRLHERGNNTFPFGTFLLASLLIAILISGVCLQFHTHFIVTLGSVLVGTSLPFGYLYWRKAKRMAKFQRQLPEALELIARALRAGHAFFVGLKLVGEEFPEPIGPEFKRAFDEVSMGISVPQALQNLADRVDCIDVKFFVTSVSVQRETGGNLAEIIESLGHVIRKRFELYMKIAALSAEGRVSAIILFALPLVLGLFLYRMNPEYIGVLFTDPIGHTMLMTGSALMIIGAFITRKMINIEV
jgi:tight adherence protein B